MIHHLAPDSTGEPQAAIGSRRRDAAAGQTLGRKGRPVFVYGRLQGLTRARLVAELVKIGCIAARSPDRAALVALAHEAAGRCIGPDGRLALPFSAAPGVALLSENGLRRLLGLAAPAPQPASAPYTPGEMARLSGLDPALCETLRLFDVIAPGGGPTTYADLATARQVAELFARGVGLPAIVAAAATLGRRGLRVSHVRLGEAPWGGGLVQRYGAGLAGLDGQFALVLDEQVGSAQDSFEAAREREEAGDLAGAERCYRRAGQLDRADPVIDFNLGNVLAAQGLVAEAAIAFRRALDRDGAFAEAAFNLARLQEAAGQPQEALASYLKAIASHPCYAQAVYNAARLLTGLRRFAEALPLWTRFIGLAPGDADIGHARRLALLCRLEARRAGPGGAVEETNR